MKLNLSKTCTFNDETTNKSLSQPFSNNLNNRASQIIKCNREGKWGIAGRSSHKLFQFRPSGCVQYPHRVQDNFHQILTEIITIILN